MADGGEVSSAGLMARISRFVYQKKRRAAKEHAEAWDQQGVVPPGNCKTKPVRPLPHPRSRLHPCFPLLPLPSDTVLLPDDVRMLSGPPVGFFSHYFFSVDVTSVQNLRTAPRTAGCHSVILTLTLWSHTITV